MPSTTLNLGRVKGSMWYTGTADSNVDIASALTSAGYTPIKLDMYLNTSNGNVYQYAPVDDGLQWTLKGNLRGAKGEGFQITKLSSSGGLLRSGNTTFISGVEDDKVNTALDIIAANSSKRKQLTPNPMTVDMNAYISYPVEVTVGGATVFVWDIEKCIKF